MQEITSVNNDLVKQVVKFQQKKYRDLEDKFLLEGFKSIEEACLAGVELNFVFVLSTKLQSYEFLPEEKIISTNEAVLKKISTTDTPPDAVALGVQKKYTMAEIKDAKKIVLLEDIKDLGNLGTILRSARAFDADAVVLFGDCAELYNPKCVRASVGNLWKIPVVYSKEVVELEKYFSAHNKIATLPRANNFLKNVKFDLPFLVMFGSEANGLSEKLIEFSTDSVKIEMVSEVESLNLSISVAIVLYKLLV
ncbi:MAG: RNA methyltransferase [Candidatus Gastranaerophilales bacterium]